MDLKGQYVHSKYSIHVILLEPQISPLLHKWLREINSKAPYATEVGSSTACAF